MSFETRPDNLPVPEDDGAADHLEGMKLADITLPSTDREDVNLADISSPIVIYMYPMTGVPGTPLPDGWDGIPGARGCTPQSCSFRDHAADLERLGIDQVFGVSTQTTGYQAEAAKRLHLPFRLLSDSELKLKTAMNLPWMEVNLPDQNNILLKRMAIIAKDSTILKVFYPVFPPEKNAAEVVEWLSNNPL